MGSAGTERLVIFTRLPRPGKVKTRLIPQLGPGGAAALQANMTARVMAWGRALAAARGVELQVRFDGGDASDMESWLGTGPIYQDQGSGDLGQRMQRALQEALDQGADRVVLVGSDLPELDDRIGADAFNALNEAGLVLGPARDGGYYLVGVAGMCPDIFNDIDWGSSQVWEQTMTRAAELGLSVRQLDRLRDLDVPQDMEVWEQASPVPAKTRTPDSISVIIPTLDEEISLHESLPPVLAVSNAEVLVVDGGSVDRSVALAREMGALAFRTSRGRGIQMNAGAERAVGDILLFLHADTVLPAGWETEVRRVLAQPDVNLGAFQFSMGITGFTPGLIEFMVRWRSKLMQMPYGDQALFLKAWTLEEIGGFPEQPLMEDVELVRRARKAGRVGLSPLKAVSSARRWQERGLWNNTFHNWLTFMAYSLGVDSERLARWYYR